MTKTFLKRITPPSIWRFLRNGRRDLRQLKTRLNRKTAPRFIEPQSQSDSILSCVIAYNKSGGYCIPRPSLHRVAPQETLAGKQYEEKTVEFVASNCSDGDIVQAGAYFGDFLPALSDACSPNAIIWAFEPNQENYRCASITIQINDLQNIRLLNAGLGASDGSATLVTKDIRGKGLGGLSKIAEDDDSALAHIIGAAPVSQTPCVPTSAQIKKVHDIGLSNANDSALATFTETIRVVAIDDVIPEDRRVSVIQLDVEDFEQQALAGALKTIQRCRPILVLESMPEDAWLSDHILRLGYEVKNKIEHNKVLICDQDICASIGGIS